MLDKYSDWEIENFELRINLIRPVDEKGHYKPADAKPVDSISVSFYKDDPFMFVETLLSHIKLLLSRNGLYTED